MASVTIYLDTRSRKVNGTYPLKLTVSHNQKSFLIPLNISIPKENWIANKIEGAIPNKDFLNSYIKERLTGVQNLLLRLKLNGKLSGTTPEQLKKMIESESSDDDPDAIPEKLLFKDHAEKFIGTRTAPSTRNLYRHTLQTIAKHYNIDTLTFEDMNYEWLQDFDVRLRPTCKLNTRSVHMRNIRAVFRDAHKKKLLSKDIYPFDDFSIKEEQTMHRDLTLEELRTLRDYPVEPHQERYRDLFMLIFYLIGINIVDILHVEKIKNGRIEYRRTKTGRLYSIKVQPEALEIINRYSPGKKYLLNFLDNYNHYEDFRKRFNDNLKKIGKSEYIHTKSKNGRGIKKKVFEPLFPKITSYYARHTWATFAAELDIPKETIAAALGHGSISVTDRYIHYNTKKVDEANRRVIDYLNGI